MGRTATAILFGAVLIILAHQLNGFERLLESGLFSGSDTAHQSSSQSNTRRPKLGDGCYHVFLDVGSNVGVHARFLFEPDKYPDSKSSVPAFAREFGYPRDNRDYCVFAFEPNPKFEQRHLDLARAYSSVGWRYVPIIAGASDTNGNLTFYHSAFEKEEWENGFSAVTPTTLYGGNATKKVVEIVRLAKWIQDEIQGRTIPANPHSTISSEPKVIMKLDIEGLEFKVFPDLLTSGALCTNIHYLMGEFHYSPGNWNYYPINLTSDGRHVLTDRKKGEELAKHLLHLPEISENCMTRISMEDDESYLTDPHPLPGTENETSASAPTDVRALQGEVVSI